MVIRALFCLCKKLQSHENKLIRLDQANKDELSLLATRAIELSAREINTEKIEMYINILFNCLEDELLSFDVKQHVLELLSSLKYEQILIIKYIIEKRPVDNINNIDFDHMETVYMVEYADDYSMEWSIVKQLCFDLVGKGLLGTVAGLMITSDIRAFVPTEFTYRFVEFLRP